MALSRSSLRVLLFLLAPLAAHAAPSASAAGAAPPGNAAAQPAPLIDPQQRYQLDAASSDMDYKTHTMVFKHIVLSQGNTVVRADQAHATCVNCRDSRWTFQGNVRIDAQLRGSLRSDQATVEVRDNRIVRATVTGNPAEFEQQRGDDLGMAKGHADQIVYDVEEGTVLLTNDAWVSDGRDEMSGPSISYNIRQEKVQATSPGASQGVHITITPQGAPKRSKSAEAPPRASGAPPAQSLSPGAGGTKSPGAVDGAKRRPRGEAQDGASGAAGPPQGRS